MEEPYGFFGAVNPTGHTAIYFARICAETPTELRRCRPGEMGSVVSRYQGIGGYDWIAMPLIPYLYSVEHRSDIPDHVDKETVERMRDHYHETHLMGLGEHISPGNLFHGGWKELVGVSFERRIYAFRFNTTEAQDDAFIEKMNGGKNRSHFQLIFNNCADFARVVLNFYFPDTFKRSFFPDAGMTTPKQIAFKLKRYARKHKGTDLQVFEIPQIPGYRRMSRSNKSVAESLVTTAYAIPLAIVNPYLTGGILVDYLIRGRFHILPKHPQVLADGRLEPLTSTNHALEYAESIPEVLSYPAPTHLPGTEAPAAETSLDFSWAGADASLVTTTAYSNIDQIRIPHE